MSAKRFPKAVVKAAAKQVQGWDGKDSEPHQVVPEVPESGDSFTAGELRMLEGAVVGFLQNEQDALRLAIGAGNEHWTRLHQREVEALKRLLEKLKRVRRPHAN